jgi:hypothetical protein
MPLQVGPLISSVPTESECPCGEDGESSEGERVVCSSRRRVDHQNVNLYRASATACYLKIATYVRPIFAIVGHQLANGIAAPRLI